ncbi:MAG: hypothetical protein RBG13Loki_2920 [Promethearchaeota archaeon CR_4]|nr:MAG: hypothetical protein RBG13Loki_2920 [Candidatus Lokiarchaeota archaeon CR_4]
MNSEENLFSSPPRERSICPFFRNPCIINSNNPVEKFFKIKVEFFSKKDFTEEMILMAVPPDCVGCVEFDPTVIPIMIVQLIIAPIVIVMSTDLIIKAYKRKKLATTTLMATYVINAGIVLTPLISNLQCFFSGYCLPSYQWVEVITFVLMSLLPMFFFTCCKELFLKNTPKWIFALYLIWGVVGLVLVLLPQNNWFVTGGDQTFRQITQTDVAAYMAVTFIIAFRGSFHAASRMEKSAERTALRLIGIGAIGGIIGLVYAAIGVFVADIFGKNNIFLTLEWVCTFIALLSFYLGFSPPGWFKRRFEKE